MATLLGNRALFLLSAFHVAHARYMRLEDDDEYVRYGGHVCWADPNKGSMKGIVTHVDAKVHIRSIGQQHLQLQNIDCNEFNVFQKFGIGLPIAFRGRIGVVHQVFLRLTLKLTNGARCTLEGENKAIFNKLVDNTEQFKEYYPGQSFASPSALFRDVQWVNGPRPALKDNQKIFSIVEEIAVSGIRILWHDSGYEANDSGSAKPSSILTEQDIEHVHAFDLYYKECIQIGVRGFYTLKESDIAKLTSLKGQPDRKKSKLSIEGPDDGKPDDNDFTCTEKPGDNGDSGHGNKGQGRQSIVGTAGGHRSDASANRGHTSRKRRQTNPQMKQYQAPLKFVAGERVCIEVISTSKLLTVMWQDGSKQENIPSTDVRTVDINELEFFPGDCVVDKTHPPHTAAYGVVQKSNHTQRTCIVKWIDKGNLETLVSAHDIGDHPDYTFWRCTIVVRLTDVVTSEINQPGDIQGNASCGQVLRVDLDGGIHVLWTDRTTSIMQPKDLLVVDTEDLSNEALDISTGQERTLVDYMQPQDSRSILDEIARRSVTALDNSTHGNIEVFNEDPIVRNNITTDEDSPTDCKVDATMSKSDSVRFQPDSNQSTDVERCIFIVLEEVPSSHQFAAQPFQAANQKQFYSVIRKEIEGLRSNLPSGLLVKGFENRLDLYSILIEGPAGTPYEDGVFLFDVQLPQNYPKSPPVVRYLSQCIGKLNPNLYEDGTICLSLLGTWSGKGSETWTSKSNLCQLVLSLQGLILVEEPYFNEAGYEKYRHSAEGAENSRMYNEMVLINMLQSLERLWKNPPETFREEVKQHLSKHLPKLLSRIYNWLGFYASTDFLQKHDIPKVEDESSLTKPGFPLLPLSVGFCIPILRNLKNLEMSFNSCA